MGRRALGRQFGWLWTAYAVSTFGSWLAFDAFAVIAVLVLHAGPTAVAVLASTGLAAGAVVALPLGPWMEFRRKRPVMVAMDLIRFAAVLSLPIAFALNVLSFGQLLAVAIVVGAADLTFTAASGACLKALVRPDELLVATSRLESTNWTAIVLGPPLGGAAIGLLGPVTTVLANAVSFLLSACGIRAIGGTEPEPRRSPSEPSGGLLAGWRYLLGHPTLRPLFGNTVLVNGLIMAIGPLLAVLMLGRLGFSPWQYGLAFALPSLGGLLGSRLASRLVARFGRHRVLLVSGTARAGWSVPLALIGHGTAGLALVMAVEFGLICCCAVYNPVLASYRLEQIATDRLARTLSAWSVTSKFGTAALTALWGMLAGVIGLRPAIGLAGLLLLASPLLLPGPERPAEPIPELVAAQAG